MGAGGRQLERELFSVFLQKYEGVLAPLHQPQEPVGKGEPNYGNISRVGELIFPYFDGKRRVWMPSSGAVPCSLVFLTPCPRDFMARSHRILGWLVVGSVAEIAD